MNQEGGKILGTGGFGCVINSKIKCKNKIKLKYRNNVTKIMNKYDAMDEYNENKIIELIDPENEFTLNGKTTACNIHMTQTKGEGKKDIKKCIQYLRSIDKVLYSKDVLGVMMENGGFSLEDYVVNMDNIGDNLRKFLINTNNRLTVLTSMRRLFLGIKILNDKGYYHYDIKLPNILYNKDTNEFNLIDFGLMTKIGTEQKISGHYSMYNMPPSNYSIQLITNEEPTKIGFDNYFGKGYTKKYFKNIFKLLEIYIPEKLKTFNHRSYGDTKQNKPSFYNIFKIGFTDYIQNTSFEDINYNYDKTVDVYALGLALLPFIDIMPNIKDDPYKKELVNILYKMINMNDKKRINQKQSLKLYDKYLKTLNKRYTKQLIKKGKTKRRKTKSIRKSKGKTRRR